MKNKVQVEWKKDDYVAISGIIDENADFSQVLTKNVPVLFLDFKKVERINSTGVRKWVNLIENLKDVELHYINCSFATAEQFSLVSDLITKKTFIESFEARYVCEKCNTTEVFTLVVGYDIIPGQYSYNDGPERMCAKCRSKLEFDHNPDSYLFFLINLGKKKK